MRLGELIKMLESMSPDQRIQPGFGNPHSYRGYYEQLAFEPCEWTTVRVALEEARSALGQGFEGYKGGHYLMDDDSHCWISEYGRWSGLELSAPLLKALCGQKITLEDLLQ